MNEQRPRLLPFRLRRRGADSYRADDVPPDAELRELLGAWPAPAPGDALRARLAGSFRARIAPAPRWRRLLAARVSVPLPVAACAAALVVLSAVALAALASKSPAPASPAAGAAPPVRFVEVPVPHERVVERVVYVERGPKAKSARRPTRPAPDAREERDGDAGPTSYFTGVDMAEFRPADELKIRVIKRGRGEEEHERKAK